jgi:hypothetical protein
LNAEVRPRHWESRAAAGNRQEVLEVLKKRLIVSLLLSLVAVSAWGEEGASGQAVLDFSKPPSQLFSARLVSLDGQNVNAPITKSSFWVDPGVHEIVVAAAINDPMKVGSKPRRQADDTPGKTTIDVIAGKRYKIAAMATDNKGNWEPVVWKEEDL